MVCGYDKNEKACKPSTAANIRTLYIKYLPIGETVWLQMEPTFKLIHLRKQPFSKKYLKIAGKF